jgi:hypothetical protein
MRHLRTDLNPAGVQQILPQSKQRIMMVEDLTVDFDTELLAWAYNGGKLDIGAVDEIDTWYSIGADNAQPPTVAPEDITRKTDFTNAAGGSTYCAAVIYDVDMVKIYNKERIASDAANAKGNYWNMFMSLEDIYACSPYKNFVCFMLLRLMARLKKFRGLAAASPFFYRRGKRTWKWQVYNYIKTNTVIQSIRQP